MRPRVLLSYLALFGLVTTGFAACVQPTIYETPTGFQPRSRAYTVAALNGVDAGEPMSSLWGLIEMREPSPIISPVANTNSYDMVFFERVNGEYRLGAGLYMWTDHPSAVDGPMSPQGRVRKYLEHFGKTSISSLQPDTQDRACPCVLHSLNEDAIDDGGSTGYEVMGYQRAGAYDSGFYLAVVHRIANKPDRDLHVVILQVAPPQRFTGVVNDAKSLARRVRLDFRG